MSLELDIIELNKSFYMPESFNKAKELFVNTNKMSFKNLEVVAEMDSTPTKKYTEWLAKQVINNGSIIFPNNKAQYTELLRKFNDLCNKNQIENKDINSYSSFAELQQVVNDVDPLTKSAIKKGVQDLSDIPKEDIFYQNDKVVIVEPDTKEKAIFYGRGTKWCTATVGVQNMWENYKNRGFRILYILSKDSDDKWAVQTDKKEYSIIWDKDNNNLNRTKLGNTLRNIISFWGVPPLMFTWDSFPPHFSNDKIIAYQIKFNDIDRIIAKFPNNKFKDLKISLERELDETKYNFTCSNIYFVYAELDNKYFILTFPPRESLTSIRVFDEGWNSVDYNTFLNTYNIPQGGHA